MAWVNDGFCGEREDFFTDAGKELVSVAAGQVPATHAVGKKNIPSEKLILTGKIKAETSGAVAGDEKELGVAPSRR